MMQKIEKQKHESQDVASGWLIAVMGGFMMGVSTAPLSMFGPLFMNVLDDRIESGGVETVVSLYFTTQCFTTLISATLAKRYGSHVCAVAAACIFCVGNLASAFSTSFIHLLVSYGVILGFGTGCMNLISSLSLNDCFTRLRTVAFGLMHSVSITVGMLYPLLMKELMQRYGNSGAQLILTAIGANVIPAAMLIRPRPSTRRGVRKIAKTEELLREDIPTSVCLKPAIADVTAEVSGRTNKSLTASFRQYWKLIAHSDPVYLLTQPDYLIIALGLTLVTLLDAFFFALLPLFLLSYRSLNLDDTTYVLVGVGAGDFTGRLLLMVFGKFLANSNRLVYWAAATLSATLITILMLVASFWVVAIISFGLGLFRGVIYVTALLIFSENYDKDLYYAAVGTNGVIAGIVNCIAGYLLGLLSDSSGGYIVKFTVIVGVMFGCSLVWLVEMSWKSCCRRKGYNPTSS